MDGLDGLGDAFGSVGEFFGGIKEAAAKGAAGIAAVAAVAASSQGSTPSEAGSESETATYDRALTGRRRVLNVNDR
jgi:hypothetical protein